MFRFALTIGLMLSTHAAFGCTGMQDMFNNPMKTRADCSFENADSSGESWNRDDLSGGIAHDRGDGKVVQKIVFGGVCRHVEALVFTDCSSGESIEILGRPSSDPDGPVIAGYSEAAIERIQPPYGPIRASGKDSVTALQAIAEESSLRYAVLGQESGNHLGTWGRYKAHCACARYYPGSVGSKRNWSPTKE